MPEVKLASVINVTRLPDGFFSFTIDGHPFPFTVQDIATSLKPGEDFPYITVTIPADRIEVINQVYDD
ncbi:hypothetical protein [Nonomuraea sp. B19D2]|uniref:hypothetical protein n=1 Tax=Nonomuraea sp. B19D2 TaxID=3159561 RepID=UPI0032DB7F16